GLLGGNSPAWVAAAFGVWRCGATLVPISTFVTARELGEVLHDADVQTLIVQPRLRSHDYLALVAELPAETRPHRVIALDAAAPSAERGAPTPKLDPQSIACILYTSGTTGRA